ncbi:MAG: InlB B-repeat-containing protein [Paludibacteraceae bacterium]|nr:InlB B-repeat-containing protein [Paludibacteraceae bacterium]
MKKIFTLLSVVLLGLGQMWGGQAHVYVYSSPQAGGYVDVQTSNTPPAEFTYTDDHDEQGGFGASGNKTFYLFYKANPGYNFRNWYKTNESNYNSKTTLTNTSDLTGQGQSVTQSATGIGAQNSYYAGIFIPIKYYMAFHGNGATSGEMANQAISYDASTPLTANAFVRQYAVTYDANEGECAETGTTANYTFSGWAKSENGAVVYTNGQSIYNLTTTENEVFDLYAVWADGAITLPEATKTGSLFDGWYNGEAWVGTTGTVIRPTADMNLIAHWATKYTPMFVLDRTEIELDQTAQLTLTNVNNPSVQITPAGIVEYNAETGALTGVGVGTATITITQQETDELVYKQEELSITVNKKTPSLSVLLNGVEQSSVIIFQGKTATISFNKVSDAEVVVTTVSGGAYASYKDGVIKAGEIGTATFRATLPETDTYGTTYVEFQVTVESDPLHLPLTMSASVWNYDPVKVASEGSNSWDNENGIILGDVGGGGFNSDDKYVILHFEGIPDKLTFEIAIPSSVGGGIGSLLGGVTNVEWFVKESATSSMPSENIWLDTYDGTTFKSYSIQLQPTTRYVLLCYSGNFGAYIRNIHISELKYVQDPEPASIDFGSAVIYSGEVVKTANVNWCNIAPMTVESSNPRFTVSPSEFANYDQLGSQEISISYTHTGEVGSNEAYITISNGNDAYTKTIYVSAETTKRIQTINWNADLVATGYAMNVGERYPSEEMAVIATAQSGELITYTSSDSEIIEVIDDTILVAKAVGTAEITAHQAGNNEYAEVSDTQTFTVTALQKQVITWDQNLYGLLTTSEPVELNATATSGMEIVYTSANENVVRVEGNMLIVVGEGETYVTATQAGGLDSLDVEWLEVSAVNYVIVRNPASQCNEMALSVGSLTLSEGSLEREYTLNGTPTTLTFSAKHGEKSGWAGGIIKPTYAALMVDQYTKVDGVWGWQTIYNQVVGTDATASGTLQLDEIATKVRFRTTESGTEHTISNIRVPRKKFMRADVVAVDEEAEANAIWQKTITVSHSNIDLMTVSTARGIISLNTATLGEGCGDFGDDAFIASFTTTEKGVEYLDTIIITDGKAQPTTLLIPVRLYSTGLKQYVNDFELPSSCYTMDEVTVLPTTTNAGLDVVYLSSDSTIAYVENNQLVILAAGTVDIIAYQAGDDRWNEVSLAKTIEIKLTPVTILEAPTATEMAIGAPLSMSQLIGGSANVEGSFAWLNPEIIPQAGYPAHTVLFTPTLSHIYDTATVQVNVMVVESPTLYGEYTAHICDGEEIDFHGEVVDYATDEPIEVYLYGANQYGGDSIVLLTVVMHMPELIESFDTLYVGDTLFVEPGVWTRVPEGTVLDEAAYKMTQVTEFDLAQYGQTEFGCDKTILRHITVEEKPIGTGMDNVQDGAARATKELRNGILYIRREGKEYTITGLEVK